MQLWMCHYNAGKYAISRFCKKSDIRHNRCKQACCLVYNTVLLLRVWPLYSLIKPLFIKRLDSVHTRCQRQILHNRWHDHISNDEVLRHTGLLAASPIIRKWKLKQFGHVARLADDFPANQILRTYCESQDGVRPFTDWKRARGQTPTTWIHPICQDTGILVTDALKIAMAWRFDWTLHVKMMMVMTVTWLQ